MSGYVFAISQCYGCKIPFTYSPSLVPSIRVNGSREPICAHCVEVANPVRIANGLAPIEVLPGAYEPEEA
jgi:hypothetical protein